MMNINSLTQDLRMMPDGQLKQVAEMYANDPMVLPLVIAEDTARKKIRASQAPQQGPQPTVVDQAVQSVGAQPEATLPEESGIAALQAPNLAGMQDGGIAGYADGGVTESYQNTDMAPGMLDFAYRSEPVVRMQAGGLGDTRVSKDLQRERDMESLRLLENELAQAVQRAATGDPRAREDVQALNREIAQVRRRVGVAADAASMAPVPVSMPAAAPAAVSIPSAPPKTQEESDREAILSGLKKAGAVALDVGTLVPRAFMAAGETAIKRPLRAMGIPIPYPPEAVYSSMTPYSDALRRQTSPEEMEAEVRRVAKRPVGIETLMGAPERGTRVAAPSAAATTATAAAPAGMEEGAGAPATPAAPMFPTMPAVQQAPAYTAPTAEQQAKAIATLTRKPDQETRTAFEELRKMYEPEAAEIEQRRKGRANEALIRAGLAMMSGTSPHAAVNIGRGGLEGLNAYQEAQRYDDQAARALRQSQITLQLAQRQEEAGNRREAITLYGQSQSLQQAAVSSAQQAQQIQQTGQYQQGSLLVAQRNAENQANYYKARIAELQRPAKEKAEMMREYGKIQAKVMDSLKSDTTFLTMTPKEQEAYRQKRLNEEIASNPFLSGLLFKSAPTGPIRDPFAKAGDEED